MKKPYKPLLPGDMIPGEHYAFCDGLNVTKERVSHWSRGVFVRHDERDPEFIFIIPRERSGMPQLWREDLNRPVHKHWSRTIATWKDWEEAGHDLDKLKKIHKARRKKETKWQKSSRRGPRQ